ncbi:MAG: FAD-binding protein [Nitriliruptorales bacterium]
MTSDARGEYEARRARLVEHYTSLPAGAPVRLAKPTSNLFRPRRRHSAARLDAHGFDGVLSVDPVRRTADVQGMTTYEHLVAATLPLGLMPLVVPQLKTITIGGAVSGLGIESSSFRNGLVHESVREMEILTGEGRLVVARPDNEHRALFYGFPNSYGTLGYVLRLVIELEPVRPFVRLRHVPFADRIDYFATMAEVCAERVFEGDPVHFVDGTVFGRDELYLTLATFVDEAPAVSDYTGMDVYYRSLQRRRDDYLTVRDYLWRWDTDWFWCSRAFGVQNPSVRRFVPKRWLRSDNYWKLVDIEKRYGLMRRLDRMRGRPPEEYVVQDIEVAIERAPDFFDFLVSEIPISPFWVCPLQQRDPRARWDLYALDPASTWVNFGFWSTVPLAAGQPDGTHNRRVEQVVEELGGRKSLYSTSYYGPDEFWRLYNGDVYNALKQAYDHEHRLLDLYEKCVGRR